MGGIVFYFLVIHVRIARHHIGGFESSAFRNDEVDFRVKISADFTVPSFVVQMMYNLTDELCG